MSQYINDETKLSNFASAVFDLAAQWDIQPLDWQVSNNDDGHITLMIGLGIRQEVSPSDLGVHVVDGAGAVDRVG
jgi:hypothetical protein